jgi:hypothetical protein
LSVGANRKVGNKNYGNAFADLKLRKKKVEKKIIDTKAMKTKPSTLMRKKFEIWVVNFGNPEHKLSLTVVTQGFTCMTI